MSKSKCRHISKSDAKGWWLCNWTPASDQLVPWWVPRGPACVSLPDCDRCDTFNSVTDEKETK